MNKSTYKIIFIAVAVVIILAVVLYFIFRNPVKDPNKTNTPVPPGSPTIKWVAESFPLNLSMYGPKIKALQIALGFKGLTPETKVDGYLGTNTKNAILAKGYVLPLSQSDYNILIASNGGSAVQNIKGAYAKYDNTIVRDQNLNEKRKVSKDTYLGMATDEDSTGTYWVIDGIEYVIKSSVYLKS